MLFEDEETSPLLSREFCLEDHQGKGETRCMRVTLLTGWLSHLIPRQHCMRVSLGESTMSFLCTQVEWRCLDSHVLVSIGLSRIRNGGESLMTCSN